MNKPLILVVEDDNSVKNLITTTLKAHEVKIPIKLTHSMRGPTII